MRVVAPAAPDLFSAVLFCLPNSPSHIFKHLHAAARNSSLPGNSFFIPGKNARAERRTIKRAAGNADKGASFVIAMDGGGETFLRFAIQLLSFNSCEFEKKPYSAINKTTRIYDNQKL